MSCVNVNVNAEIELEDFEKETLIRAYRILGNIANDMWAEDLEDTEEAFKVTEAMDGLQRFMEHMEIDYSQD